MPSAPSLLSKHLKGNFKRDARCEALAAYLVASDLHSCLEDNGSANELSEDMLLNSIHKVHTRHTAETLKIFSNHLLDREVALGVPIQCPVLLIPWQVVLVSSKNGSITEVEATGGELVDFSALLLSK